MCQEGGRCSFLHSIRKARRISWRGIGCQAGDSCLLDFSACNEVTSPFPFPLFLHAMPFQRINQWIVKNASTRRQATALPVLRAHRPVADSRLAGKLGIGWGPFRTLDRALEGDDGVNQFASCVVLVALVLWVMIIPLSSLEGVASAAGRGFLVAASALFLARSALVARRFNRLSLAQMERIQEWLKEFPDASRAASLWMRPGIDLYVGDYRAIRRAVSACRERAGLPPLPSDLSGTPSWFSNFMSRLHMGAISRVSRASDSDPESAWAQEVSEGVKWVRNNVSAQSSPQSALIAPLSKEDQAEIASLAMVRDARVQRSLPADIGEKTAWKEWLLKSQTGSSPTTQGRGLFWGWGRASVFQSMKAATIIGIILVLGGQVMEVQVYALDIPQPGVEVPEGEARDAVITFMAWVFRTVVAMGDHFYWPALAIFLVSLSQEAKVLPTLSRLKGAWWGAPITREGRRSLDEILYRLPFLRTHFSALNRPHLVQADLAFAREVERKLRHVARAQESMEDLSRREEALEQIPSVAEYRARQLAAKMEVNLPTSDTESTLSSRRF